MIHKSYEWKGKDGIRLYGQSWLPEGNAHAIINYIHGFKDHSDRFAHWAERLTAHGYGIAAIDLRGHGRSEGKRGYAPGFHSYLDDVAVLMEQSVNMFGKCTYFLYGHSLGGNIVANYLISDNLLPSAAIISSPWFKLTLQPSMMEMFMAQVLRRILPGVSVASNLDVESLSRNKAVVKNYLNDPMVHNLIRPKLFMEIEFNGLKASRNIYKINVPLLVMHGTADRITSIRQTRSFVMNASRQTTYKEWPDAYHELHNDIIEQEVFDFVLGWLNNQSNNG